MKTKLLFADPRFFEADPAKIKIEDNAETGRVYFLIGRRRREEIIVAVGIPEEPRP